MVFQNRMDQLDFPKQQQTALDILRDFMILKSITVIEHDVFSVTQFSTMNSISQCFDTRNKKKIVSHDNLDHDIKMQVSQGVLFIQSYRYFSN